MSDAIDNERFRKLLLSLPGKAIEFLYNHYYHSLVNIARTLTHDQEASEDIVQETFILVWEKHKWLGQHHDKSIQHYLVRVVKNKAITYYKKNIRILDSRIKYMNGNSFPLNDPSVEANIIELEISREIREIISTFPRREKECLLMKIDKEMTTEQIAVELNVSKKAVERSVTSANKRLRRLWLLKI